MSENEPFKRALLAPALLAAVAALSACNGSGSSSAPLAVAGPSIPPDTSESDPVNPPGGGTDPAYGTDVLLYNGTGVSTSDWQTTEQIIRSQGMSYALVNASRLNAMTLDEIAGHGLIVVPGGSGGTIYGNLSTQARLNVRRAVRDRGVGYVGFCAGAWVAVGPEAATERTASYGFAVAPGSVLDLFLPGGRNATAAMVDVTFADSSHRQLVWWGGPITPEWNGGVVARYDTGEPAISQTYSGKGFVVISGPHPEAPQGWRSTAGADSDGLDYDIAADMFEAALKKRPLPAF